MRSKQQQGPSTDAPPEAGHGSPGLTADPLHHSATRSAFQNFAGIVPRPCDRGDVSAMAQVGSEHLPAAAGPACGHVGEAPPAAAAQALAAPAAAAALLVAGLGQQPLLQPPGLAAPPGGSQALSLMRDSCRWTGVCIQSALCPCSCLSTSRPHASCLVSCTGGPEACLAVQVLAAPPVCCCRCRRQAATSALLSCLHGGCGAAPHDCGQVCCQQEGGHCAIQGEA